MGTYDELARLEQAGSPTPPADTKSQLPGGLPTPTEPATPASLSKSRRHDVITDVNFPQPDSTVLRAWRQTIENTETHNSALRLSSKEREAVDDCLRLLRRKFRIKTSMNELARLGLLLLIHDLEERSEKSLIHAVKQL